MRDAIPKRSLFILNRERLEKLLLPNSLVAVNANDILPTNADGTFPIAVNSDLFYLSGIEQEQSILLLFPDAEAEKHRALLFLREPTAELELWDGQKLSKEEARAISGIEQIHWLDEFPQLFHRLMCECHQVYLNSNEHKRAVIEAETREARFVAETIRGYPLHDYQRLAPLMHRLRAVKSPAEIDLLRAACQITEHGFRRILKKVRPGISEARVEAEFAHEFISRQARFAYQPIIASGKNACALHYTANRAICRPGQLLLLDVAAKYANYNADMTRTIPVSGRFTRRQKQVYNSVLKVLRASKAALVPGKKWTEWQLETELMIEAECLSLGLIRRADLKRKEGTAPAFRKYFMHGAGHPLGLDVHDVGLTTEPFAEGWVMTVEPAIYLPEEGWAVRLENDVLIAKEGPIDLMATIPIEAEEIEDLMNKNGRSARRPRLPRARAGQRGRRAARQAVRAG